MHSAKQSKSYQWIGKQGNGPLIVIPESKLESWTGREGDDLERARSSDDYLSFVEVAGGDALVLGDEPFETTWLPTPSSGGGMLVRRLWSKSASDALDAARTIDADMWSFEDGVLEIPSGRLVLFDAARPGHSPRTSIMIELEPGRYAIATGDAEPDEETCVMVHRLFPIV